MNTESIANLYNEMEIPLDSRPLVDGIGEMDQDRYTFNRLSVIPLGVYDESMMKETTALLIIAAIKKDGLLLATIPFFFRYGSLRIHSKSLFQFKNDANYQKFIVWLTNIVKTF